VHNEDEDDARSGSESRGDDVGDLGDRGDVGVTVEDDVEEAGTVLDAKSSIFVLAAVILYKTSKLANKKEINTNKCCKSVPSKTVALAGMIPFPSNELKTNKSRICITCCK
jgi:hypothetical protein